MIVSTYYNRENDTVLMATTKQQNSVETIDNITVLKNEGATVGVNAHNLGLNLNPGLNDSKAMPDSLTKLFAEELENPFEVGLIESVEKHPKSEKLNVCQVRLNSGTTQIVCGAANVSSGIKVIVAKVGAVMPNGMSIVPSKLIDVPSNGMICSLRELGREQLSPGIEILGDDYQVGQDYL
ncbi:DUF4479 domain-containing protein [Mollicutes bacterium LVI A0039]|nr:DUF4479 domain-containing protein [Mollicutes bacterium LVI A0039]